MKLQSDFVKFFFLTPTGAVTMIVLVICAVVSISSIDIQFPDTQRRNLDWLIGAKTDLGAFGAQSTSEPPTRTLKGGPDDASKTIPEALYPPPPQLSKRGVQTPETDAPGPALKGRTAPDLALDTGPSVAIMWKYEVCLLVSIGRTQKRTGRSALPYGELYRLFSAVKGAAREPEHRNALSKGGQMFVGTDSPSIVCKMVRDALGPSVLCSVFSRLKDKQCKHVVVGETKKYSQQLPLDTTRNLWATIETVDLDAKDPAREPPSLPESQWRPTIVTAFSTNHLEVGLLLLRSIGRAASEQNAYNISVVVWTMDDFPQTARKACACVVEELRTLYKVPTEVRPFDFNAWPTWMHINQKRGYKGGRGEYAWKAIMIHTVLLERGFVYWADAGDRFKSATGLTQTLQHVRLKGFASRNSRGIVKDWCHVKQLQYLEANKPAILKLPNCDASGIGFTLQRYKELARPWYECSIVRQCIAPDGSSRKNHRQDQAALTVLAALSGDECQGVSSEVVKHMDSKPDSYAIGVDPTQCYKDPLAFKWH